MIQQPNYDRFSQASHAATICSPPAAHRALTVGASAHRPRRARVKCRESYHRLLATLLHRAQLAGIIAPAWPSTSVPQKDKPKAEPFTSATDDDSGSRFNTAWGQLFGNTPMQAFFADSELNARVYTLDADSGYKVQNKTVGGGRPLDEEEDEHSSRLSFPKKARRGETHGRARLSRDDVIAIRAWAAQFTDLSKAPPWTEKAAAMHVSEGTLRDIVNRRTWTHVH